MPYSLQKSKLMTSDWLTKKAFFLTLTFSYIYYHKEPSKQEILPCHWPTEPFLPDSWSKENKFPGGRGTSWFFLSATPCDRSPLHRRWTRIQLILRVFWPSMSTLTISHCIRRSMDVRNNFMVLHDLLTKNLEKLRKPRSMRAHMSSMY